MNLHGIVAGQIAQVNPFTPAQLRISAGQSAPAANGFRAPLYEAPGSVTGSITGTTLTVTAQTAGKLASGQLLAAAGIVADTSITSQLSGSAGGLGTYAVNRSQALASSVITTDLIVPAQVQPMSYRDLLMVEGLNLAGERRKVYLYGQTDSVVRVQRKGGDLITIATGVHAGVWLVAQVTETWPNWCAAVCTLQNGS